MYLHRYKGLYIYIYINIYTVLLLGVVFFGGVFFESGICWTTKTKTTSQETHGVRLILLMDQKSGDHQLIW